MASSKTSVVNVKEVGPEGFDIYIGRRNSYHGYGQSIWANPFKVGKGGDRVEVVKKYEEWLREQPELMARLPELRGKRLGCWCWPQLCHGDVLARLADKGGTVDE